ncbi:MAG: NAD-dependent epimerase/dehydratase family protein, partial [Rhodobacteraceae bacterium]|nr:NAD-dependent epimerase/dehydratase family protein [Paracoccaceae bacterium]
MRVLLTGGSGRIGAFVAPALAAAGHAVIHLARRPPLSPDWLPWDLAAPPPPLPPADALVHLAFDHEPGAYRGGEGDDPDRFLRLNRDGSIALVAAARAAGIARIVFLSSRAVYGDARPGETLRETDRPAPDTLYGAMKLDVERAVADIPGGVALRATGVYGLAPGATEHKWTALFADYLGGQTAAPRIATELHGADLADAVLLLLAGPAPERVLNASDLTLDRHDLLAAVQARTGCRFQPPP